MKQKLKLFLKGILVMLLLAMKSLPCNAIGAYGAVDFNRLTNRNGLSNSQVNAIFKDQKGYVWFGTQSGLDRFDGFRMKAFLYVDGNPNSLTIRWMKFSRPSTGRCGFIPGWDIASTSMTKSDSTASQRNGSRPSAWMDLLTNCSSTRRKTCG